MSWDGTLKYGPVNPSKVNEILSTYKGHPLLDYVIELYRLIDYQKERIVHQEQKIIALKHIEAWKHYDRSLDGYDSKTRQYNKNPE